MASRLDRIENWKARARLVKYSVALLAARVGVSERQLERYFLSRFGLLPKQWMDQLRITNGQRDVRRGLSIKEAADRAHYAYPQDFSAAFKRIKGTTPSQWRGQKPPSRPA